MVGRKSVHRQSQLWQASDSDPSSSSDPSGSSSTTEVKRTKRQVTVATFEKWQRVLIEHTRGCDVRGVETGRSLVISGVESVESMKTTFVE